MEERTIARLSTLKSNLVEYIKNAEKTIFAMETVIAELEELLKVPVENPEEFPDK